jgi:hypothetical protein
MWRRKQWENQGNGATLDPSLNFWITSSILWFEPIVIPFNMMPCNCHLNSEPILVTFKVLSCHLPPQFSSLNLWPGPKRLLHSVGPKNHSLVVYLFLKCGNDFPKLSTGRCGEQTFSVLRNRNLKQGGSRTHTTRECDFSHTKAASDDKCVR